MRLVKDGDVFISDNENWLEAYIENGYVEEMEEPKATPKKTTKTSK